MSTEPKMTPWFVNGEEPWEPGVYNVSCRKRRQSGKYFAFWNGYQFATTANSVAKAFRLGHRTDTEWAAKVNLSGSWRGLARKP